MIRIKFKVVSNYKKPAEIIELEDEKAFVEFLRRNDFEQAEDATWDSPRFIVDECEDEGIDFEVDFYDDWIE